MRPFVLLMLLCSAVLGMCRSAPVRAESVEREVPLRMWSAPPFWSPAVSREAADQSGRTAPATGRQALGGGGPLSSPLPFVAVAPCRVADTRVGSGFVGAYGSPAIQAQVLRSFVIGGQCGIPATAEAVSFSFTVINETTAGNFRAFPTGTAMPTVGGAVLVWSATTGAITNSAVVPVGGNPGSLDIFMNGGAGNTADLILDVNGYYAADTGNVLVSAGFGSWRPFNSADPVSYTYFSSQTQVSRSSIGSNFLSVNPDLTPVLYGKSLMLTGVQFCYDTFASTTLNYVEINTYSHTTGSLGRNLRFSDSTVRSGNECRIYSLPTPVTLTANDGVNFFIQVNWTVASSQFAIGRTTFILEATGTVAALPAARTQPGGSDTEASSWAPASFSTSPALPDNGR
jgi:hypothetical protein